MSFTSIEKKRFFEFRKEVMTYEVITTEDLWMLIRRYTNGFMGRHFFNDELKHRYYKYWITILEKEGIIKLKGSLAWEVNEIQNN
jgi:hypothetical protein